MNTVQYIDLIRKKYSCSDYRVAKMLGISPSNVSNYRHTAGEFADEIAIRAAELLDMNPQKVLADIHAERSKDPKVKAIWAKIASSAAMFILSFTLIMQPADANTIVANAASNNIIDYAHVRC